MRKTWKKLAAMAVTASMVICGGAMGVSAATEEEPEKVTVNVAYMPDYASLNGLISAIELGYFDDEKSVNNYLKELMNKTYDLLSNEDGHVDIHKCFEHDKESLYQNGLGVIGVILSKVAYHYNQTGQNKIVKISKEEFTNTFSKLFRPYQILILKEDK